MRIVYKIYLLIYNNITLPLKRLRARYKKTHYECRICGIIEAPYFSIPIWGVSITEDCGWHKIDGGRRHIDWICHQCADHRYGFVTSKEWKEKVINYNESVLKRIKAKDPVYYKKHFEVD